MELSCYGDAMLPHRSFCTVLEYTFDKPSGELGLAAKVLLGLAGAGASAFICYYVLVVGRLPAPSAPAVKRVVQAAGGIAVALLGAAFVAMALRHDYGVPLPQVGERFQAVYGAGNEGVLGKGRVVELRPPTVVLEFGSRKYSIDWRQAVSTVK